MADNHFYPRFQPCRLLHESQIPCVVWFEDAIAHYGVPTLGFDLYVLVPDIDEAAEALKQRGWTLAEQEQAKIGNAIVESAQHCLIPPKNDSGKAGSDTGTLSKEPPPLPSKEPSGPTTTVILPAADWNFALPERRQYSSDGSPTAFFPPLPGLLDALIDSSLDAPSDNSMLRGHLACQVSYIYSYTAAKERSFAEYLKYEHRQYHFDSLSGMTTGTIQFIDHQRTIREALRRGEYQLRECSAARDNEDLFNEKVQARILASLPPPVSFEKSNKECGKQGNLGFRSNIRRISITSIIHSLSLCFQRVRGKPRE
jgi:hypothetical protein